MIAQANREKQIKTNSNKYTWNEGDKICNENATICGSLEKWNSNKSKAQIKILASRGGQYEGQDLTKNNTIWITTSGKGWHKCLDDELETVFNNSTASSNSSSSNRNNSNTVTSSQAAIAGAYAKKFAKKMMYACNKFKNQRNLSANIRNVSFYDSDQQGKQYKINITISWNEGQGFENHYFEFSGVLLIDMYGSEGLFLINKRKEPSILGLGVCTEELDAASRKRVSSICPGAKWGFVKSLN